MRTPNESPRQEIQMRIEFRRSNSPYFHEALSVAQQMPTYAETQSRGGTVYSVACTKVHFERFVELARIVWGWKTTRITLGQRTVGPGDFWRLSRVRDCHMRRQEFRHKRPYCYVGDNYYDSDNLFPCKLTSLSLPDLVSGSKYGEVTPVGSIQLDKERIAFELERQLRLEFAFYCPSFDHEAAEAILRRLPDVLSASDRDDIQRRERTLRSFGVTIDLGTVHDEGESTGRVNGIDGLEELLGDIDLDGLPED